MKRSLLSLTILISMSFLAAPVRAQLNYFYNFDVADTFWAKAIAIDTVNYAHNQWQIGKPQKAIFDSSRTYPNALVTDTLNPYASDDTSVFVVNIPGIIISSGYHWWPWEFSFYYKLNSDSSSIAKIEFSSDTGAHWVDLADTVLQPFWVPDTLKQTNSWTQYYIHFPFEGWPARDYMLRFTFISDSSDTTSKDGWMIDDMKMHFGTEDVATLDKHISVAIYPNPATNECTIACEDYQDVTVAIYDLTGKVICEHLLTGTSTKISLRNIPPGSYICRVNKAGIIQCAQKLFIAE